MSDQNKAHIRRVIEEVYNGGNLSVVDQVAARDMIIHAPSQDIRGSEGAKQYVSAFRTGFPDLHFTIEDQVAEGDMVVTRWTARHPSGRVPGASGDWSGNPTIRNRYRPLRRRQGRRVLGARR